MLHRAPAATTLPATSPLRVLFLASIAVAITGCAEPAYSVRQFYEPAQLLWEPAAIGTWAESDTATETVTIACDGYRRLRLRIVLADTVVEAAAHPFELDGHRVADLAFRAEGAVGYAPLLHALIRYAVVGDTLWWGFGDDVDWRARLGATGWKYLHNRHTVVMDLPTSALQAIALAQLRDSAVVWHLSPLLRRSVGEPAPPRARVLAAARRDCARHSGLCSPAVGECGRGR